MKGIYTFWLYLTHSEIFVYRLQKDMSHLVTHPSLKRLLHNVLLCFLAHRFSVLTPHSSSPLAEIREMRRPSWRHTSNDFWGTSWRTEERGQRKHITVWDTPLVCMPNASSDHPSPNYKCPHDPLVPGMSNCPSLISTIQVSSALFYMTM